MYDDLDYTAEQLNVDKILLQKFQYGMQFALSKDVLTQGIEVHVATDPFWRRMTDEVRMSFRKDVFGIEKEIRTIKYPLTWKDAVKEHFYPKLPRFIRQRLTTKYPIKYNELKLVARELYPTVSVPQEQCYVTLNVLRRSDSGEFRPY